MNGSGKNFRGSMLFCRVLLFFAAVYIAVPACGEQEISNPGIYGDNILSDGLKASAAPQNVTVSQVGMTSTLNWDAVSGADTYNLYWSTEPNVTKDTGTKIAGIVSTSYNFVIENCYYIVTAVTSGYGESTPSEEIKVPAVVDNGDGTVSEFGTNLTWQKCTNGQNNDSTCSGTAVEYNWYEASGTANSVINPNSTDLCGSLALAGYSDWRLPNKDELLTLIDVSNTPTIDTASFPNTLSSYYWSSSTGGIASNYAWWVSYTDGSYDTGDLSLDKYVRCVRDF